MVAGGRGPLLRIRQAGVTWREVGGEVVALDLERSTYFTTNKTGTHLWHRLVDGATADDLVKLIRERFAVDHEVAAADVKAFLGSLEDHRLLDEVDGP